MAVATSTMAAISIASMIASTAVSAYGAYKQSQAAKAQANYQAAVARNNSIIAERNAKAIQEAGQTQADAQRRKIASVKGSARVAMGAAGVALDEGSPSDILVDIESLGELDVQTIKSNAEREAYNARVQGMNYQAQAGLYSAQASAQSPLLAGGSALLSGASSVAGKWYTFSKGGDL